MSKKKDKTPDEVREARRAKTVRRYWIGGGFLALWWVMFGLSFLPGMGWLLPVSYIALTGEVVFLYGLHEKALRKIANRPEVDYNQLHKMQKAELKSRPAEVEGDQES